MVRWLERRLPGGYIVSIWWHLLYGRDQVRLLDLGGLVVTSICVKVLVVVLALASHLVAVQLVIVVLLVVVAARHHHWSRGLLYQQLSEVSADLLRAPDLLSLDLIKPGEDVLDKRLWLGGLQVYVHGQPIRLGQDIRSIVLHIRMEVFDELEGCHAQVFRDQSTSDQPESRRHRGQVGLG